MLEASVRAARVRRWCVGRGQGLLRPILERFSITVENFKTGSRARSLRKKKTTLVAEASMVIKVCCYVWQVCVRECVLLWSGGCRMAKQEAKIRETGAANMDVFSEWRLLQHILYRPMCSPALLTAMT